MRGHALWFGGLLVLPWLGSDGNIVTLKQAHAIVAETRAMGSAEDLLASAQQYDKEAETHLAEAKRYEERAADIDPLTDTKGYRRTGLIIAGESHRTLALELQTRARIHRITAERLQGQRNER
jgi:hypothetical protein